MAIPTYEAIMLPFLRSLADGHVHRTRDVRDRLAKEFHLTTDERERMLPSGNQQVFANRLGWARTYLGKAGLICSENRGCWVITEAGKQLLAEEPERIDSRILERFPAFRSFKRTATEGTSELVKGSIVDSVATPDEIIEAAYAQHLSQVESELLDAVKVSSPAFFERVVLVLLRAMGYGGLQGKGEVTAASADGGIDGVIHEDKLGLDTICIQAKRWEGTVGRPVVQGFVGSMDMHRSRKGVVLTTGSFSRDAFAYIDRIEGKKVVLIDGVQLARLMVEHRVGVKSRKSYELVELSQDFFDEEP